MTKDDVLIEQGDCVKHLRSFKSNTIELFVTSPPYGNLRTYSGHCQWDFEAVAKEIFRVLVPGGVLCWNEGDSVVKGCETLLPMEHAIYFKSIGFTAHDTMIYERLNFSHPERTRYHSMWEFVFIMSKGKPRVFHPIKDKKNATAGCIGNLGINTYTERDGSKSVRSKKLTAEFGMRGNVWRGKTRGQEDMCEALPHTAMMPRWLPRDLIQTWSNPGDIVCDPFVGSGTVIEEALKLHRKVIGIDINPTSCELTVKNCQKLL